MLHGAALALVLATATAGMAVLGATGPVVTLEMAGWYARRKAAAADAPRGEALRWSLGCLLVTEKSRRAAQR